MSIYKKIARSMPGLDLKLKQASIYDEPEHYVKKIVFNSLILSASIAFIAYLFSEEGIVFLFIPIFAPIFFMYFARYVDIKIEKIKRTIDQEVIYAGRFLIIELESGVPVHKAMQNIEQNYEVLGQYFGDILNKVFLGTSLEEAINDTMINTPSANLRKILWQILNSLKTGADIGPSLNTVIDQIVREQQIAVAEYGKKLNPMAMFYMMAAIIVPSLGITMLVILATFIGLKITLPFFLIIAGFLAFIQFMFLSLIRTSRPPMSI